MARSLKPKARPSKDPLSNVQKVIKPRAVLRNWHLKKQAAASVVQLVGTFGGGKGNDSFTEQKFTTSTIIARISGTDVQTISGSVYRLQGKLDEAEMKAEGFSDSIIRAFANGFPENWEGFIVKEFAKVASAKKFDFSQKIELVSSAVKKPKYEKQDLEHRTRPALTVPLIRKQGSQNPAVAKANPNVPKNAVVRSTPFYERLRPRNPVAAVKGVAKKGPTVNGVVSKAAGKPNVTSRFSATSKPAGQKQLTPKMTAISVPTLDGLRALANRSSSSGQKGAGEDVKPKAVKKAADDDVTENKNNGKPYGWAIRSAPPAKPYGWAIRSQVLKKPTGPVKIKGVKRLSVAKGPAVLKKKVTQKRTIHWYSTAAAEAAKGSVETMQNPLFPEANADQVAALPVAQWPEPTDTFAPLVSSDTTKVFRMSLAVRPAVKQSPSYVPSNDQKARDRQNFSAYLENEKRVGVKRPRVNQPEPRAPKIRGFASDIPELPEDEEV